jgi:hypothetical protein
MKNQSPKADFKIPLTLFYTFGKTKLRFLRRDLEQLARFGITAGKLDALENELDAWADLPTDEEMEGDKMVATQRKEVLSGQLRELLTGLLFRAESHFGYHSADYRSFGATSVVRLSHRKLLLAGRRIYRRADRYLEELSGEGLTMEMLVQLKNLLDEYEEAIMQQEDAVANRIEATLERIGRANEIYRLLVRYCRTARQVWGAVNEARYNDFLLSDAPSAETKKKKTRPATASEAAEAAKPEKQAIERSVSLNQEFALATDG